MAMPLGPSVRVTEAHVHMYQKSPFIAHALIRGACAFPPRDEDSAAYAWKIQQQILKSKFVAGASKATDLSLDRSGKKLLAAIAAGADVICNVLACHEVSGLQYEAKADVLQLDGQQYMVKVISSQAVPSAYFITKALFCRFLLAKEQVEKLHQDVAVVLANGSEVFFNSCKIIQEHCEGLEDLLKARPSPTAQDLALHPSLAEVARRRLLEEDSLELLPLKVAQKRQLRAMGVRSLSGFRRISFPEIKQVMSEQVFLKLQKHAELLRDDSKDYCRLASGGRAAYPAALVLDVVVGSEPAGTAFAVAGPEGNEVFHDLDGLLRKMSSCEVFYFGGAVEELCLSCLARGRPDLAARALSVKATNLATWLRQAVCSKVGETLEAYCAAILGPSEDTAHFGSLPELLEMSQSRHLSQSELEQLRERLQERAKRKVGSLWRLFQWLSQHAEPPQAVPAVFQRELVQLCSKFQQGGRSDWPQKIWDIAKKWPDYHKYELFWSLFDANELYKGSEEEWTSHVLCLSQLERVENNARVEEKLGPNGRFVVRSLHLEYKWKVPQETSLKEKDEVLVKEDTTLRGKVLRVENSSGRPSKVTLLFDTNFKKNPNLDALLSPHMRCISIMQAKFSLNDGGENVMTRAVETQLASITRQPWADVRQSFRGFLQREPVADSSLQEAHAEELVSSMVQGYLIIQGPPGTGKTFISAKSIGALLRRREACRVMISSNSHKAIRNLLSTVSALGLPVAKVLGNDESRAELSAEGIQSVENGRDIFFPFGISILGGTASQLMKLQGADYLFVDEAGQVTLELLAVLAQRAENLVLVGDQQQLPPPVQQRVLLTQSGGSSCLDYFTQGAARVDGRCGIFLATTYRMSAQLTEVVSVNFYDRQLLPAQRCGGNRVCLAPGLATREAGVEFLAAPHEGNLQSSEEEAEVVKSLVQQLLQSKVVLENEPARDLKEEDIIIVCPYNAQAVLVRSTLGSQFGRVRVGSVDLFQGQQAAVSIVSFGASSGAGGRALFVLDGRRTNVALSRARALALLVGSPSLGRGRVEAQELELQNRYLCWSSQVFP